MIFPHLVRVKLLALFISGHFDESGTHSGSAYTVMGGYVATEAQWAVFDWAWRNLLSTYGLTRFHSKEFRGRAGEFKGWTVRRQDEFAKVAEALLARSTLFSIVAGLVNRDHDEFRKNPGIKHYRHSHYGACFHQCMANAVKIVERNFAGEQISFVLEAGHKNAGDAARIFTTAKIGKLNSAGKQTILAPYLGDLSFQSGLSSLEAADFLAHRAYRDILGEKFKSNARTGNNVRLFVDKRFFEMLRPRLVEVKEDLARYAKSRLRDNRG